MTKDAPQQARRSRAPVRVGRVVANTGRDILVLMDSPVTGRPAIRLSNVVLVEEGEGAAVGIVTGINAPAPGLDSDGDELWIVQVEMVGTLSEADGRFLRGVQAPPALGTIVHLASADDLERLHRNGQECALPFGTVHGAAKVQATLDPEALTRGGFAIFGTADSGKSSTLASLTRALLRAKFPVHTLLIDPYNEFSRSFSKAAVVVEPSPGLFPHWLLTSDEMAWLLSLNGGALDRDEQSILNEAIVIARRNHLRRTAHPSEGGAIDGPIPYRVTDIISYLDKVSYADSNRPAAAFRRLRERVMTAVGDSRLSIIFGLSAGADNLAALIEDLFRLNGPPPMAVLQLGRLPEGLDRLIVAVLARLCAAVVEWSSVQRNICLMVDNIERYAPAEITDEVARFSRRALRALGGRPRKLGASVGFTSASPREVDRDLLSRCETVFLHRMPSPLDADAAEEVLPETAPASLDSLATLAQREVIGVGAGVTFTGRLTVAELPDIAVPGARMSRPDYPGADDAMAIVHRWRHGTGDADDYLEAKG